MFKVVTDQLKVSQGWVRCGHCTEVFDASLYLQPEQSPLADASNAAYVNKVDTKPEADIQREEWLITKPRLAMQPLHADPDVDPMGTKKVLIEVSGADLSRSDVVCEPLEPLHGEDVSFVRDARRQAFWRRPVVRIALGFFSLLLITFLVLQFLLHQRDSLASLEPRLKPLLEMLCEPMQCEIAPLRHIESVVVDSSTFNKINGDSYQLSFSLKNTGAIPVAMPSLEVTLTDTQEQALIRRVVTPTQFGVKDEGSLLSAGSDFSGLIVMQVLGSDVQGSVGLSPPVTGPLRVVGYRVLAFYP